MIHSVMPPKVADWLMNEGQGENMDEMFPISGGKNGAAPGTNTGPTGPTSNATKSAGNQKGKNKADEDGKEDEEKDEFELSDDESESG